MMLFAALDVTTGKVNGSLHRRHRAAEFAKFLNKQVPESLDVHLILDNYATRKTPTSRSGCRPIPGSTYIGRRPARPG